jgi:hypothetical protein
VEVVSHRQVNSANNLGDAFALDALKGSSLSTVWSAEYNLRGPVCGVARRAWALMGKTKPEKMMIVANVTDERQQPSLFHNHQLELPKNRTITGFSTDLLVEGSSGARHSKPG